LPLVSILNINAKVNHDIFGVEYAAVLENIYALGVGIAHGLNPIVFKLSVLDLSTLIKD